MNLRNSVCTPSGGPRGLRYCALENVMGPEPYSDFELSRRVSKDETFYSEITTFSFPTRFLEVLVCFKTLSLVSRSCKVLMMPSLCL